MASEVRPRKDPPLAPLSLIEPGIFLGDIRNVRYFTMRDNHINAVVTCYNTFYGQWGAEPFTTYVPRGNHIWIECLDSSTQDLLQHMKRACDFIDKILQPSEEDKHNSSPPAVLVHCERGVSRSPTMVIAYLMRKYRKPLDEALAIVASKRKIKPNANFMEQLRVWEEVEYYIWEDEGGTVPKQPYKDYLARRAERLKEKGLTGNEPMRPLTLI